MTAIIIQGILELVVELATPETENDGAVEVEGCRQLNEAVCLVGNRLHQHDLVGEAQVDNQGGSSYDQIRRNERLNQKDEYKRVAVSNKTTNNGDHQFNDSTPDWSDYIVATSAGYRSWCECTSNAVDGCNEVD